ncbi:glycosyltransferase family 2 protein [Polaromonas sp. LjRoot131]|uniref:glycosyltransferase family 2 protein n=1 Tax=Polaromonas sp. LjRoot131 TaxID=3342262 RepID=UPI003ED04FC0
MRILGFGKKWHLRKTETITVGNKALLKGTHRLVGITRVRNESLVLGDTLDYVGEQVDAIVAYDDASTDGTLDILLNHPKVAMVIGNALWERDTIARLSAETRHRGLLLQLARSKLNFDWALCFDADERITGNLREFIGSESAARYNGVRVRLFDAYMTAEDHTPFVHGQRLLDFRRFFGPEQRDILMLWRNLPAVQYSGLDSREPTGVDHVITNFYCQHYGKAISVDQWEETCDYYIKHFPPETYGQKWLARKGHAVHTHSDFSRPLFEWGAHLFNNAVPLDQTAPTLPAKRKTSAFSN